MDPSNSDPSSKAFWRIPDGLEVTGRLTRSTAAWPKWNNYIEMFRSGYSADCDIFCGKKRWRAHKSILNRCRYFKHAFSPEISFKEARESQIKIKDFEPFEIEWLLDFIYGERIDAEESKSTDPNKSFLETCILLWSIGDYFLLDDLCQFALTQLQKCCRVFLLRSRSLTAMLKNIDFLPDLEAGIRAAWRHDRAAGPGRKDLISLCVGIHPFVKDHPSFISLLDEIPEFTAQYLKALLGCPGLQSIESHVPLGTNCEMCQKVVFNTKGVLVSSEAFVWTPTSMSFWDNCPYWCCSKKCYNQAVDKFVFPGPTEPLEPFKAWKPSKPFGNIKETLGCDK